MSDPDEQSEDKEYLRDASGSELYNIISTTDTSRIFAKNRDGLPYYAKLNGNEYYPKIDGSEVPIDENGYQVYVKKDDSEVYPKNALLDEFTLYDSNGDPVYAKNHSLKVYYPRDRDGNEFVVQNVYIFDDDGSVRYPLKSGGSPRYPVDLDTGDEYYLEGLDHNLSIAKDEDGNHVYASRSVDSDPVHYYPADRGIGYRIDGMPIYVSDGNGNVVFPKDDQNNEFYLKIKNSQTDYLEDYKGNDIIRYAVDNQHNQIYPVREVEGGKTYQVILYDWYAMVDNDHVYPLDEYNNEYTVEDFLCYILKDGKVWYPITYDGYVIVPNLKGKPLILEDVTPSVKKADIRCQLKRTPRTDFLTDVQSPRIPRLTHGPLYETLPLSEVGGKKNSTVTCKFY